eukprot:2501077-Rhodomonas_salina.1
MLLRSYYTMHGTELGYAAIHSPASASGSRVDYPRSLLRYLQDGPGRRGVPTGRPAVQDLGYLGSRVQDLVELGPRTRYCITSDPEKPLHWQNQVY